MGCCISSGDRRPPPSAEEDVEEEETVKEVLMETVPPVAAAHNEKKAMPEANLDRPMESRSMAEVRHQDGKVNEEIVSEVSEASEVCSYSESYSNAAAASERKDGEEDGVVNQRPPVRKRRAPAGGRGRGQGRRSLAPEKRGQVAPVRALRGRPVVGQPQNVVQLENGRRRDGGEGSGRRRELGEGKNGVSREGGNGVVLGEGGDGAVSGERENGIVLGERGNGVVSREGEDGVVLGEEVESLENPIVSLECFIFL